jgi:hypothetical protein
LTFVGTGYLDDVIVLGRSFEDMVINLRKVYDRLLAAGLNLKAKKCHLFCKKVVYLGHVISEAGTATDQMLSDIHLSIQIFAPFL